MAVAHNANPMVETDRTRSIDIDTGQLMADLDTGQQMARLNSHDCSTALAWLSDPTLAIEHHEIHRIDEIDGEQRELVTSTLKAFKLRVAVQTAAGDMLTDIDGMALKATLVYEDGSLVEEVSATQEPPLLGGQAIVEDGVASFRLRITVLTSLCHARRFRVKLHVDGCPDLSCISAAVKTITKLRRGSRGSREEREAARERGAASCSPSDDAVGDSSSPWPACGGKRSLGILDSLEGWQQAKCCDLDTSATALGGDATECAAAEDDLSSHTLDQLWDEIHDNGTKLLELQKQQRVLFKQLRAIREACEEKDS